MGIVLSGVRLNWVAVHKPKKNMQDQDEYSVQIIIPKTNTKALQILEEAFNRTITKATEDFGSKITRGVKNTKLKDGDEARDKNDKPIDVLKDCYFMTVGNKKQPALLRAFKRNGVVVKQPLTEEETYSGMWGQVEINPFFYNSKANVGVTYYLNTVVKTKDDTNLGSSSGPMDIDDEGLEEIQDEMDEYIASLDNEEEIKKTEEVKKNLNKTTKATANMHKPTGDADWDSI